MTDHKSQDHVICRDCGPVGVKVWELLHAFYETDAECRAWLESRQPLLHNRIPLAMLYKGEGEAVRDMLQAICDGAFL